MTWGADWAGGDSGAVQGRLTNVQQIQATRFAFVAILADRSVVTWGDYRWGGDSIKVQDQLRNVQQIQASMFAFVAILGDGSVATRGHDPSACYGRWGCDSSGRYSGQIQHQLKNVQQIRGLLETEPNWGSWAAILTWRWIRCYLGLWLRCPRSCCPQSASKENHVPVRPILTTGTLILLYESLL